MSKSLEEHLVHYLSDAYAIEQQALAQLRKAPEVAGETHLASHFHQHLEETEAQAAMVRARLEAHGGSPSKVKDAVMALGGEGFLLFARVQPDTPGKLTAHALSHEALEWASYDLLVRMAERAEDDETAAVARTIRAQERAMMERLEASMEEAVTASLDAVGTDELAQHLEHYLADAHALEMQAEQLLKRGEKMAGTDELAKVYAEALEESRTHAKRLEQRLQSLDGDTSVVKDWAMKAGGVNWSLFFLAQKDTPGKLAAFVYAYLHLLIAGYELLRRVAERAGDGITAQLAAELADHDRAMAEALAGRFEAAFEASLEALGVES